MRKETKEAIKRLKASGYEEVYLVTNYISNDKGCTDLWALYDNLEDALRWVRSAHLVDSICKVIETECFELPIEMEEPGTSPIVWWKSTDNAHHTVKQEFLIQRVI